VEIQGIRIGEVVSVDVYYATDSNSFVAPVRIVLQPSLFPVAGVRPRTATEVYDAADMLVRRGLRAQVSDTQLLGGDAIVTSAFQLSAAAGDAGPGGGTGTAGAATTRRRELPSSSSR
jgi:hypothetical protein